MLYCKRLSKVTVSIHSKENVTKKILLMLCLACAGSFLQIVGVSWDVTSHLMKTPETFFTPSHVLLYSGIGVLIVATLIGAILILNGKIDKTNPIITPFRLFIIGSIFAAIAGPSDYAWHKIFGIDGLLSPTHLVLATGIIINSVSVVVGLRIVAKQVHSSMHKKMIKILMIPAFAALWLTLIWYVYLFILPLSNGSHFDFNLNPVVESIVAITLLPIIDAFVLLTAVRTLDMKWSATIITTLVVLINSFTNIIPSIHLSPFLPLYLLLIGIAILYDFITQKSRTRATIINREKNFVIAGALIGSVFYILGYPLLPITFAEPLGFTFHSMSELYENFIVTLPGILLFMLPFGAFIGSISTIIVLKIETTRRSQESIENNLEPSSGGEPS